MQTLKRLMNKLEYQSVSSRENCNFQEDQDPMSTGGKTAYVGNELFSSEVCAVSKDSVPQSRRMLLMARVREL